MEKIIRRERFASVEHIINARQTEYGNALTRIEVVPSTEQKESSALWKTCPNLALNFHLTTASRGSQRKTKIRRKFYDQTSATLNYTGKKEQTRRTSSPLSLSLSFSLSTEFRKICAKYL